MTAKQEKTEEESTSTNIKSNIRMCGCTANSFGQTNGAKYQDSILGVGMRYYTGSPTGSVQACTVCGREIKKS